MRKAGYFAKEISILCAVAIAVGGCAGQPDKAKKGLHTDSLQLPDYDSSKVPASITEARMRIAKDKRELDDDISFYRNEQTGFDSALIASAVATVATAFFKSPRDIIGGIGIGTGGLLAYEKYYDPAGTGLAKIKAKAAYACILSKSQPYLMVNDLASQDATAFSTGTVPDNSQDANYSGSLKTTQADIRLKVQAAQQAAADLRSSATKPGASGIHALSANAQANAADSTADAANAALQAIENERAAFILAPQTIWDAHNTVTNYLDMTKHRAAPNIGSVESDISGAITQAGTAVANTKTAQTQLVNALKAQASANASQPKTTDVKDDKTPPAVQQDINAKTTDLQTKTNVLATTTQQALSSLPSPLFSTLNANITHCVDGLPNS